MKLTHLIAQFLYKNKRLDLQGIGSFFLDKPIVIEPDNNKDSSASSIEGITFENNQSIKEDPELVAFISGYTGKIKALAAADLNSHLELAKQFLNIGKPFLFEGIGSLTKVRNGEYAFTPGSILTEKLSENKPRDKKSVSTIEEPVSDYKSALYKTTDKKSWKKPVTFLFVVVGVAVAVWGGYRVYKRNSANITNNKTVVSVKDNATLLQDSSGQTHDTLNKPKSISPGNLAGSKKFVLEISNKDRAIQRYNRLKAFQWDVQIETSDSVSFKLFMLLPVSAADTTHVLDSLTRLNGRKVFIEN